MSPGPLFSLLEFTRSETARKRGIQNGVPEALLPVATFTLAGLVRTRAFLGHPMLLSSGFRCPQLNLLVGGAPDSQHCKAEAADFTCPDFGTPFEICQALGDPHNMRILGIDQLIWEGEWVHISFTANPRYQALKLSGGKFLPLFS